jgi:hypothetical protein
MEGARLNRLKTLVARSVWCTFRDVTISSTTNHGREGSRFYEIINICLYKKLLDKLTDYLYMKLLVLDKLTD